MNQLRYSQNIDFLMYLVSATRFNISFVVNKLSQVVSNTRDDHQHALDIVM
jgi:hypothetical protein